jgi:hypothetical protein
MILRWTIAAISDAATRFRRIAGARAAMTKLVVALRSRDSQSSQLETHTKAA